MSKDTKKNRCIHYIINTVHSENTRRHTQLIPPIDIMFTTCSHVYFTPHKKKITTRNNTYILYILQLCQQPSHLTLFQRNLSQLQILILPVNIPQVDLATLPPDIPSEEPTSVNFFFKWLSHFCPNFFFQSGSLTFYNIITTLEFIRGAYLHFYFRPY